jgi:hypothetical protein
LLLYTNRDGFEVFKRQDVAQLTLRKFVFSSGSVTDQIPSPRLRGEGWGEGLGGMIQPYGAFCSAALTLTLSRGTGRGYLARG